jgi:hypothetical protein
MYNKVESTSIMETLTALSESTEIQLSKFNDKINNLDPLKISELLHKNATTKQPKWSNKLNAIDKRFTVINSKLDELRQELLSKFNHMVTIEQHDKDKRVLSDALIPAVTDSTAPVQVSTWVFAIATDNIRVYRNPDDTHENIIDDLMIDKTEKVLLIYPVVDNWITCRRLYSSGDIVTAWVPLINNDNVPNFTDFTFSSG